MKLLSPSFVQLCHQLSDLQFHDGTALGQSLKMTRTAIWKYIKKLQGYGVEVECVKGKGYRLHRPLYLLNSDVISNVLIKQTQQHAEIVLFESLPSTNHYLHHEGETTTKVALAEHQSQGRGRFARAWHSPFGQNIYMSIRYLIEKDPSELGGLSLSIGVSLCQALEKWIPLKTPLSLKWPNDILFDAKKLAGILIEMRAEAHNACLLTIGIGLNVNMDSPRDEAIQQPWISLKQITQQEQNRNLFVGELAAAILTGLVRFETQGFQAFIDEWEKRDYLKDQSIQVQSGRYVYKGTGAGVDLLGQLVLIDEQQERRTFAAGESSLLK